NGSLKDYVPSHYQLGYLLANYGYLTYGDEFWKNVTRDASAFKGLFYPFQKAIRRYAGVDYKTFRNQAFDFYRKQLGEARDSNLIDNRTVTSYHYPQYIGQDSLLYLKTGYNRLPVFFIRRGNREQRLGMQSISSEEWFSYRSGKIAYTALATNARWSLVNYSDLVLFDLSAHKEKRLSRHKRYYTPDLSPSGERLAAVCLTDSLRSELHVLRSDDGSLIRRFELEHPGDLFAQPRFVDEERVVVSRRTADARMELLLFSLADGSREVLVPATHHTISLPYVAGNTVYFTAGFHKNDDIYAVDLTGKTVKRLTTGFTGHYFPSVYKDTLVWSHFTANGLELRKAALSSLSGETVSLAGEEAPALFPVAFPRNLLSVETQRFASKRYNKGKGLFNFHSWNPSYNDPEFTFSLYSDNILNTFSNEIFYRYNQNERSNTVGWNTSYGGFFPQINAGAEYTFDRTIRTTARSIDLSQFEARIGYNIPLNITRGKTYRFLNFGSNHVYNKATVKGIYKDSFDLRGVSYLHHFLGWSHYLPMAVQHIYPRFGYTLSGAHRHLLNDDGFQFFGLAQLFLPSVRNHSIVLAGSWQETDTLNTTFSNRFAFSRGYVDFYFSRMRRFSANYHFPIAYPDFGIASIVYFQRLRGNLFYDFTRVFSADKRQSADLRSVGGELFFDTRWWNQQPVSFGLRLSYLLDRGFSAADTKGSYYFEFVLPVNLIPD
ncbi:MAG TPA: hypothetical protein VFR58_02770, partial [Flavisolibacter sp.]|nr:hypothetical protein [Flavisolibacter sp.]